ncbi:glutathione S-transferase N-terminal domain-containing protein [Leptolyngbya sp. 15MV]|nr:glutathione S-transferase N-terminal domain-containing protein [Leptolyngbya sp. 15MV]
MEFVPVDLTRGEHKEPAFLALNPNGLVPLLQDGARVIWETTAITTHLALRAGSALWPREPERQVEVLRWFSWASDHFTRAGGELYFEHLIKSRFGLGTPDAEAIDAATRRFRRYAAVLDAHLDGRAWLLGEAPTLADFHVAAALPYAAEAHIPLRAFPRAARWHDQLNAWPAWRSPFPVTAAAA